MFSLKTFHCTGKREIASWRCHMEGEQNKTKQNQSTNTKVEDLILTDSQKQ